MKKIISFVLAALLALGLGVTAFAGDITSAGGSGSSAVELDQDATLFSVTVPTSLPISVDENGNAKASDSAYIYNNSYGPILIKDIKVVTANGWSLAPYTTDFKSEKVGLKQFGLMLNGDAVETDGTLALSSNNWPSISGGGELQISYAANVAAQSAVISGATIANVVITVAWDDISSEYILAKDADFSGSSNYEFTYIGSDEYVEVPAVIKGVELTSLNGMFANNTTVKGVKLPDSDLITSMDNTFYYSTVEEVINIPESVVSVVSAFEGCDSLITAPELPDGVLYITCIFSFCFNLVTPPDIPASVIFMNNVFFNCKSLTGEIRIDANPECCFSFFSDAATNEGTYLTVSGDSTMLDEIFSTKSENSHIYPAV